MVDSISQIASTLESITMEAAAVATSKLGESSYTYYSKNLNFDQIATLLNSRNNREVKDAMKRILSIMASDDSTIDIELFFSDVVKNISSNDIKIKRMVYIYLLRFAEKDPHLALLSVNTIQKSLSATDPETRCLALKSLSDIRIPSLCPIILLSIKKAIVDPSSIVRCEVAYSLLKLYRWKKDEFEIEIIELFKDLLDDSEPNVISSAIILMKECFSEKLELLHGHYRYYCQILRNLDSWAQFYLIELLIVYCKTYIPRPELIDLSSDDESHSIPLPDHYNKITFPVYQLKMDSDLELFINSLRILKFSTNPSVIISCCNAFFQLTTPNDFRNSKFPEALMKSVMTSTNTGAKMSLLQSILFYSKLDSTLFLPFYKNFLLFSTEGTGIACLKLEILSSLIIDSNVELILHELKKYINYSPIEMIVITASHALASTTHLSVALESHVMNWFINTMERKKNTLSSEVLNCFVNIIRELVSNNPYRHLKVILKLADLLKTDKIEMDNARAGIVWLFGEIAGIEFKICPDVLMSLIPNFTEEGPETRREIILLSAKLFSYEADLNMDNNKYDIENSRIAKMFKYLTYLGKFDDNFNIRDRVRYLTSIFDTGKYEIATLLLQAPKPRITSDDGTENGILTSTINKDVVRYHAYISWKNEIVSQETDIRENAKLKDYNRYKKSFSSNNFIDSPASVSLQINNFSIENDRHTIQSNFTSNSGKKYKLQSLDEFFSDISSEPVVKKYNSMPNRKRIVTVKEEESDSEEESSSEDKSAEETTDSSDEDEDVVISAAAV